MTIPDKLWTFIGAQVWAPGTGCECGDECADVPIYGPHIDYRRDQTGHRSSDVRPYPGGWTIVRCECGWEDLSINYANHIDDVAPWVAVLS